MISFITNLSFVTISIYSPILLLNLVNFKIKWEVKTSRLRLILFEFPRQTLEFSGNRINVRTRDCTAGNKTSHVKTNWNYNTYSRQYVHYSQLELESILICAIYSHKETWAIIIILQLFEISHLHASGQDKFNWW